jgi:DNA-binding transcriptional LysR family regulator
VIAYPFIWRETGSATRRAFEQSALKSGYEKEDFDVAALVDDMDTMIRSVEAGLGVAIISEKVASSLSGRVKVADIKDFNEDRVFYMINLKSTSFSPAAEAFSLYVKSQVKSR